MVATAPPFGLFTSSSARQSDASKLPEMQAIEFNITGRVEFVWLRATVVV